MQIALTAVKKKKPDELPFPDFSMGCASAGFWKLSQKCDSSHFCDKESVADALKTIIGRAGAGFANLVAGRLAFG